MTHPLITILVGLSILSLYGDGLVMRDYEKGLSWLPYYVEKKGDMNEEQRKFYLPDDRNYLDIQLLKMDENLALLLIHQTSSHEFVEFKPGSPGFIYYYSYVNGQGNQVINYTKKTTIWSIRRLAPDKKLLITEKSFEGLPKECRSLKLEF
jgi:hypothetical protein